LISGTDNNPKIKQIERELEEVKQSVISSIVSHQRDLRIKKNDLLNQRALYEGKVYNVPTNERFYNEIARQQKIKETLYLYLLQKREETEISLAVTSPKAKIIDAAYLTGPITIKSSLVYFIAFVLGLALPIGFLTLLFALDTKIKSHIDVEGKVSVPYLGDIPRSDNSEELIDSNSRSSSAEAVRMIRTNLEFVLSNVQQGRCKTIFVTSSIPKEGKTFIAVNLATTIALSGKKVLIIGLDIRNPKLDTYINLPAKGLTNFLSKTGESIQDYIIKVKGYENFYALPSGVIPPNPVELLMNDKVNRLCDELKTEFDYIIVDTAPVSVVTDTFLISHNADAFIYVMRANYLDKRMLRFVETLFKDLQFFFQILLKQF
jgi:capsular exopolysaccharide synthesis family protein